MTISLALAFCIFVWLRTNAFVEFCGWLFSWGNIFYVRDYATQPDAVRDSLRYPLWLYTQHRCMLTKLLSCPLCLSFWTNLFFGASVQEKLASVFVTLVAFSILDKLYQHE